MGLDYEVDDEQNKIWISPSVPTLQDAMKFTLRSTRVFAIEELTDILVTSLDLIIERIDL